MPGKRTLVKLLARLYDPLTARFCWMGSIFVTIRWKTFAKRSE